MVGIPTDVKLSIITITYNNFDDLKKTVESTLSSNTLNYKLEIVIINGGDCTESKDYLNNLKQTTLINKNFTINSISEKDRGIADAFNKGISLAKGELVIFLNSGDVLIDKNYFQEAIKILDNNINIDFVHAAVMFTDIIAGPIVMVPRMCHEGRGMPYYHQTMIFRKNSILKAGLFDINFKITMDYELIIRMHKLKMSGEYFPHYVVEMDGGGVSATNEIQSINESKRSMIKNGVYDYKHKYYFFRRVLFFKIRRFLQRIYLTRLLVVIKKISNSFRALNKLD